MEKHRYNSIEARYAKVNRVFLLGGYLLFAAMIIYVTMYMKEVEIERSTLIGNCACIVAFAIINTAVFIKNQASKVLRILITVEVCIEFAYYSATTSAEFLGMALMGLLGISLAYYENKFFGGMFLLCSVLYIGFQIFRMTNGLIGTDANSICLTIMTCAIYIMLFRIGKVTKMFSDDSLAAIEEQNRLQKQMMDEILDISQIVKEESDRSKEMMERLVDSAQQTASNIREISQTTDTTADNLVKQTGMTKDIQTAITETKTRSHEMVAVAADSNDQIHENSEMMDDLKAHSAQIMHVNAQMTESMEKLQLKTKEVENFTDVILNISTQINLLAVNASIESARAGNAGKGFAVVAGQIRQLAEETRQSTDSIVKIVDGLKANSQEVVESIHISVDAAEKQNDMILTTADMFHQIGQNMSQLISNIDIIDAKIEELSDSNNTMVDSISQISASTQEVTANAEQTNDITKQNLKYAQDTRRAINSIQDTASRLEQYI